MKIVFIRPATSPETIGLQHVMIVEPLELEILAAVLDKEDSPVILDMIIEKREIAWYLKKETPDLVCVTGYITNVNTIIEYCKTAKALFPNVKTVVGGVHCEVCPEDFNHRAIDYRVVRNGATAFKKLVEHIKTNAPLPGSVLTAGTPVQWESLPHFDFTVPHPRRDLTARYRKKYFYIFHDKVALLKTAFGCPFTCKFCFCRQITKEQYVERELDDVIDELAKIKEKEIYIVDDDFLCRRSRILDFIKKTKERGIKKNYLLYGRADFIAANPDVMKQFKEAGLRTVIVGFESFFDDELAGYDKKTDSAANEKAMEVLNRLKIDCFATVIIPPHWGKEEFRFLRDKVRELGIHYINLQPLTPLPGTGFKAKEGTLLIPEKEYEKWDLAHITIQPQKMGVPEFYQCILDLYQDILFQGKILWKYITRYSPRMLWKMLKGSYLVRKQYLRKKKESQTNA